MRSSTKTALAGFVGSLALSAVLWWYFQSFVVFLFLPFVPFLFRRSSSGVSEPPEASIAECPQCGFHTRDESFEYCPRDGTRLE